MRRQLRAWRWLVGCVVMAAVVVGCSVEFTGGDGEQTVTLGILGKTFQITFRDVGAIEAKADEAVTVATAIRLFDENPPQTPPSAQMILPSANVGVAQRLSKTAARRARELPLSGSATLRFMIAPGSSVELCATATLLAEYDLVLTTGTVALVNEVYDISPEAIAAMMSNDVTICIEVVSDFDGDLTIGDVSFGFGGGPGGDAPPPADIGPVIRSGGGLQIPIDNRSGKAVLAPINRTIGGVSYGIVGVLDAVTPAVTQPAGEPSTISVDQFELGLFSVDTLYLATHSSFVPDVGPGVTLATLTVKYNEAGSDTVLDFVTGSNTAEWSYDRTEHVTMYGGVQHAKVATLYDFETSVGSASTYTGYVYSVSLPVDATRTLASMSLSMTSPASYAGSRAVTGPLAEWAGQAITAITLAGTAPEAPDEPQRVACCLPDGRCVEVTFRDCEVSLGGVAQEGRTSCDSVSCPAGTPVVTQACCTYEGPCLDLTPTECGNLSDTTGDPAGSGTSCDSFQCLQACCMDFGVACEDWPAFKCKSLIGDPQGEGTDCASNICPELQACCLPDGTCENADPVACSVARGEPGGTQGLTCSALAINGLACAQPEGACCKPDGCCDVLIKQDCEDLGGTFQGIDTDCNSDPCPEAWSCLSIINFPDPSKYAAIEPACEGSAGKLLIAFPGGGSDPEEPALFKDDLMPGVSYSTKAEAAAACCELFDNFTTDPASIPTGRRGGAAYGLDQSILDNCEKLGACCHSDDQCTEASKDDCAALADTLGPTEFKGPGTACDGSTCASPVVFGVPTAAVCPSSLVVNIGPFTPILLDATFNKFVLLPPYSGDCQYVRADGEPGGWSLVIWYKPFGLGGTPSGACGNTSGSDKVREFSLMRSTLRTIDATWLLVQGSSLVDYDTVLGQLVDNAVSAGVGGECP